MSVTGSGIQALNFMGFLDRREESLMLNGAQQQAVLKRLLNGQPRNANGKNRVMPFWN